MIGLENLNQTWASLLIEECIRNGLDTFFLAPGSRCTPLTVAVARQPDAHVVQHFDERGLAFAALGYARATGRPGVVITTSGSAVSNLHPAVVEAAQDQVPMLLLTGDRPPELRDSGANQSIDQIHHFGSALESFTDLCCPDEAVSPTYVLTTLDQAIYKTRKGPVHVNCMFREPLAPSEDPGFDAEFWLKPVQGWRGNRSPYSAWQAPVSEVSELAEADVGEWLRDGDRVLLIAGGGLTEAESQAVAQLAATRHWPLVADLCSNLLFGKGGSTVIRHIDALLPDGRFTPETSPTVVIQFGVRFLSKPLLQALEHGPQRHWIHVSSRQQRLDPVHRVSHRIVAEADSYCMILEHHAMNPEHVPGDRWLRPWLEADAQAEQVLHTHLDGSHTLTEPGVARTLTRLLPNLHGLIAGSSMPVRDLTRFAARNKHIVHVASNRGASGIDGTIATAVGFARGLQLPVTAMLGDLTALHDLNSLAMIQQSQQPVILVVINNQGGGIFHFLPVADQEEIFEPYFGTPHPYDFSSAARMFQIAYHRPTTLDEFVEAYRMSIEQKRAALIEVRSDRRTNHSRQIALAKALMNPIGAGRSESER